MAHPPDRLSALDASFLDLDTAVAPLHVGWTMRFEGTAPPVAQLRRHLEARLDHVPRFRRRVTAPRLGLGDLRWSDDPGFDVARHVHALRLAAPGGPGELRELAGTLLSVPLDPARPLWRLYLVDGLAGGGFALIGQAHHALVDGIAAIEVALLLFTPEAPAPADGTDGGPWLPAGPVPLVDGLTDAVRSRVGGGGRTARALLGAARRTDAARLREVAGALESFARPSAATSLDRTVGPAREVAFATTDLEGVRDAGRRHGGTINDVLLAACALALGRALRRRGEQPETVKVLVPVNVRDGTPGGRRRGQQDLVRRRRPAGRRDRPGARAAPRPRPDPGREGGRGGRPARRAGRRRRRAARHGASRGHPHRGEGRLVHGDRQQRARTTGRPRAAGPPAGRALPGGAVPGRARPDDRGAELPRAAARRGDRRRGRRARRGRSRPGPRAGVRHPARPARRARGHALARAGPPPPSRRDRYFAARRETVPLSDTT
nr:wax ester/triacylglycerol synthase domain-containing protein [Conexibacter sp. W3-3-2]